MGGGASKQTHVKEQFTLPPEQVPYQGTILQYSFMNVNTHMTSHFSFNFSQGETMVTSNVDEYYPILAQNYKDGFKLEQFVKIPFAVSQTGFFSLTVAVPYQAVYCRKYISQQQTTSWQLKIEKSIIYMSRLGGGKLFSLRHEFSSTTSDLSHMYEIIQRNAAAGGRFVCMEQTGMVQSQGMSMAMAGVCPGMGTDLFFNMPLHPNPVIYTYMAISVQIPISIPHTIGGSVDMTCDWMGILSQYLNQGWRLADIYMDDVNKLIGEHRTHSGYRNLSRQRFINSVWFFEKEASKLEDQSPLYESTIVEYHVKVSAQFGGVSSDFDISHLCQEMGNRGWKLTCVLQTPKVVGRGFMSAKCAILLFFQRRIMRPINLADPALQGHVGASGFDPPPPSYDSAVGSASH